MLIPILRQTLQKPGMCEEASMGAQSLLGFV